MKPTLLIVDDEKPTREGLRAGLEERFDVYLAEDVATAVDLLERNPNPTEADIRTGLAGNLCRCTGYMKIFESVVRACEK